MTTRSDERAEFLAGVLTTAVEGGINYWASVEGYRWGFSDLGRSSGGKLDEHEQAYASAVVFDLEEGDEQAHEVNIETIAKGLGILRDKRSELSSYFREEVLLADRTNGEDGDIDAGAADLILQYGIFGEAVYG